ncbi:hypothetical protein BCR32DRAFT_293958 [Anaeromyces robustus]|uniref:Uncharacterized protein n=1 Tax=Anaeromyces robustus TaxID=1754192 RepID=A0A1Y1X3D2_9FUNG|nr:hypothetical protein BCR32DRAFT_293958 [Anaeromyces robustus]|eukprot:ORX80202.1 hypothetical protein BCR32DRAFT_293958 [Anaeromyces robustus]
MKQKLILIYAYPGISNGVTFVERAKLEIYILLSVLIVSDYEPGTYIKCPFLLRSVLLLMYELFAIKKKLLRSAALLNDILLGVCKRHHMLFNKFKTNLSKNDNVDKQ